MINIAALPKPGVLQELDFEVILAQNEADFKKLVPDWEKLEGDVFALLLEAFAYRELYLRAEINRLAQAFFLSTTTGASLDNYATFYNVERFENESDEDFKMRILLSMADKSTAGSEETYKSFTFKADERVEDVVVLNGGAGVVEVYYFSTQTDDAIDANIEAMLNKKDVRPLTDKVEVKKAVQIPFEIEAELRVLPNQETSSIYANALKSLESGLKSLQKIGVDITLSEINDFLKVDGVKEVVIAKPTANVVVNPNEIGVCDATTLTLATARI